MAKSKWTTQQIGDLSGQTAIVTGANTGLGLETASKLAAAGAHVLLAVRNLGKGASALATIRDRHPDTSARLIELDLAVLTSVRSAAGAILATTDRIDLLINNAGVMYTPAATTADGFEMQFGTNHLGHFALTNLLLERITAMARSRIVTVSSVGHKIKSKIDLDTINSLDNYDRIAAYGRSKLANLLFTYELQRRLDDAEVSTLAVAAHPGGSHTELGRNSPLPMRLAIAATKPLQQSAAMGALPTLRAATDPEASGGTYYGPDGPGEMRGHPELVESSKRSHDTDLQRRLWDLSETLTKPGRIPDRS